MFKAILSSFWQALPRWSQRYAWLDEAPMRAWMRMEFARSDGSDSSGEVKLDSMGCAGGAIHSRLASHSVMPESGVRPLGPGRKCSKLHAGGIQLK